MTKEDVLHIQHSLLSTIDGVATMDDTESFKTFGYMSGVNEMAKEIIKFLDTPIDKPIEDRRNDISKGIDEPTMALY